MVSALWNACSEGNLENVHELLKEASPVDIEIKDQSGVTPLIEAVKNGHAEVVRVLLDQGADPTNASSQGSPEQYTTDPAILELLEAAKSKVNSNVAAAQEVPYAPDPNMDPSRGYYGPPMGAYYYGGMPVGAPMLPEGAIAYYPPPAPVPSEQNPGGIPNLPPPEVARMIPCRYYPACRYGSSCIFAHPQTPYLQGPLPPPAQYPTPYDPMAPAPYPPPYYAMSPPSFSTSPNGAHMNAMSPPPGSHHLPHPSMHGRSGSEIVSPIQAPFSPSGVPPMPYGAVPPMSPTYGHPGQVPVPVSLPPLPPLQHSNGGPQSPQHSMYPPVSPGAPGGMPSYSMPRDSMGQFPPQGVLPNGTIADSATSPQSPSAHPQADGYGHGPMNRDPMTHHRRGSVRRPSIGGPGRKPPCLFFPMGRCRNGDECRFPHVLPDGPLPYQSTHHHMHFPMRGGHRPRPSGHMNGVVNGGASIEEKFAGMAIQDHDRQSAHIHNGTNGTNGTSGTANSSRSQSTDPGSRRGPPGYKPNHLPNGLRTDKKFPPAKPQRVPNADEFPTLTSTTPPLRSPSINGSVNGYTGPTAAQVLQAPPPRKENPSAPRVSTPDQGSKDSKPEPNGTTVEPIVGKLPVSFAAAAAPDTAKEVSVSA